MAFEDFNNNEPVLILTDKEHDTSIDALRNRIVVQPGEGATTDNFNRSIDSSINRDIALEAALTYLARASSLFTTSNTKFLSHCEGKGIDVVGYKSPTISLGPTKYNECFINDQTFIGAAWPQRSTTNILSYSPELIDSHLASATGWTLNTGELGSSVNFQQDSTSNLWISTIGITVDGEPKTKPGTVTVETPALRIVDADYSSTSEEEIAKMLPPVISTGIMMKTLQNMIMADVEVQYGISFYTNTITPMLIANTTYTTTICKEEFDGQVALENVPVPKNAGYFKLFIKVKFKGQQSFIDLTFKDAMVQAGAALTPYAEVSREACYCQYDDVINPEKSGTSMKSITVSCWSKFKRYSLETQTRELIGPLFVNFNESIFGGVHRKNDDNLTTSDTFSVRAIFRATNISANEYGSPIRIPTRYLDEYILTALRIRPDETSPSKLVFEYVVCLGPEVLKSSISVTAASIGETVLGKIILGSDKVINSDNTTWAEPFNGPVTEVRYDSEWLSDAELYIMSLAKKPFSHKVSKDMSITTPVETAAEVLDNVGINLVLNPTGRLHLMGWNNIPTEGFNTVHDDQDVGNAFILERSLPESTDGYVLNVYSDEIKVKPNETYSLRAIMNTSNPTTGKIGIGIRWLLPHNDIYDHLDDRVLREDTINCKNLYVPEYYSISAVAPEGAEQASIFMYADTREEALETSKATWSRIKFEQGSPTQYSEDFGAQYAVYY